MSQNQLKWLYLILLSLVWGSSFILIKKGLVVLSPIQLGALRIFLTGSILLIVGHKSLRAIKKANYKWIVVSGFLGSFFPAFLFAFAQTEVDSAIASILNSLVPLNTIFFGLTVFSIKATKRQLIGVFIGFIGSLLLIVSSANLNPDQNYFYAGFILIATFMYALNLNIIKKYLSEEKPLAIASGNFVAIIVPAIMILIFSDFFSKKVLGQEGFFEAIFYVALLALVGTAVAKVVFNKLIQIASTVFASSVTYTITIVAVSWGVLDGEKIGFLQVFAGVIIIVGVYLSNKKPI